MSYPVVRMLLISTLLVLFIAHSSLSFSIPSSTTKTLRHTIQTTKLLGLIEDSNEGVTTKNDDITPLGSTKFLTRRRSLLKSIVLSSVATTTAATPLISSVLPAEAASEDDVQNSKQMENGMLESRVLENVMSPPPYGMEGNDIFYPNYFTGVWDVASTTTSIEAPCGPSLFGGNATFANAQAEIGTSLIYKARFINNGIDKKAYSTIADREYNVAEIAKAAMGPNSVLDVPIATPNKVSCILSPSGAGRVMQADLLALARRQESISPCEFHASEVVRQIVSSPNDNRNGNRPPTSPPNVMTASRRGSLLKEVESVSLYNALPSTDEGGEIREIRCKTRSATFLLPSQDDPTAYRMWQMSRGRPIDVRYYDVIYTKR